MKRILSWAFAFVVSSAALQAQAPEAPKMPVDEITQLITYTDVEEEADLNKDTIYTRALRWFKTFYKNPTEAIKKADPEARTIEGAYRFKIQRPEAGSKKNPPPMVDAGHVLYKIKIMCKDGRYKYEISNITWMQTSTYPIERWLDPKKPGYDANAPYYLKQTDDYMKALIDSLTRFIETEPVKKKEEW